MKTNKKWCPYEVFQQKKIKNIEKHCFETMKTKKNQPTYRFYGENGDLLSKW
jgi:hypothetical protein